MRTQIYEIEKIFKEIFESEDGLVRTVDSVYELSNDEKYYKLVISIHGLSTRDQSIIHTKFIFKSDLDKKYLIDESFSYLYDINCIYHKIEFSGYLDLKTKISDIIESDNFGEDIKMLSDFIESPAIFLNYYMKKHGITEYSIFDVEYEPKFKTTPCDKTTFDFKFNINNNYKIELSIYKIDREDADGYDVYKFQFKFMDDVVTFENDSIKNLHSFIGEHIAKVLDKKLKNK